jgi:hypothetical protein
MLKYRVTGPGAEFIPHFGFIVVYVEETHVSN